MAEYKFTMPELGEGLVEGEIVSWHVKPGDAIKEDDILCEIQNDKAVVEVPSAVNGTVKELHVEEGTVSNVGDLLATFDVEGAVPDQGGTTEEEAEEPVSEPAKAEETPKQAASAAATTSSDYDPRKILATPAVRKFAREQGVDITQVTGTGKNGKISREDVENFISGGGEQPVAEAPAASTPASATTTTSGGYREEERVPLRGVRKAIANAMVKSVYTAPHVTIMDEVDVTKLVEFREQMKPMMEKKEIRVTYLPYIVKALVAAVREYPELNASIDDENDEIVYKKYYDIGIAADTDQGLVVPVVKEADRKSIWMIAETIKDLAVRARDGKLAADEMRGSTITITNIGSAGGMFFTPVINHPEVAILGTGRISDKPVIRDGEITAGKMMALSLSFDHRLIDGATAQYAMNYIKQLLEEPQLLVMEV